MPVNHSVYDLVASEAGKSNAVTSVYRLRQWKEGRDPLTVNQILTDMSGE